MCKQEDHSHQTPQLFKAVESFRGVDSRPLVNPSGIGFEEEKHVDATCIWTLNGSDSMLNPCKTRSTVPNISP